MLETQTLIDGMHFIFKNSDRAYTSPVKNMSNGQDFQETAVIIGKLKKTC